MSGTNRVAVVGGGIVGLAVAPTAPNEIAYSSSSIAQESFQTLLSRYPGSQKAPDALLKVGYSQYEQKQWDQAEATLNEVVQKYPDTTVARLAQGRLRALQSESRH